LEQVVDVDIDRWIGDVRTETIIKIMKVVEFVRQSPSCVMKCFSEMKVCELSDESSEGV
jgi:hypothetical protein